METILVALLSSISSVSLAALLAFLCRNWMLERLKASVKHEYDLKLESYKSQITRRVQAYEEAIGALYNMIIYLMLRSHPSKSVLFQDGKNKIRIIHRLPDLQ
jgi:hypothetical protein